jgi:hypothetical protein
MSRLSKLRWRVALAVGLISLATARAADAGFTAYTSSSNFKAALVTDGLAMKTEDYGAGFTDRELIDNGSMFDGLTYHFKSTATLQGGLIQSKYNSLTGLSLGAHQSTGDQFFYDGDQFAVTFSQPVYAVGIFFNVNPNSGTFGLTTPTGIAITGSTSYDTGTFVFAGEISTTPFTSAIFFSDSGGRNLASYNVPTIFFGAAPEPTSFALAGLGLVALAIGRKVRSGRADSPR